MMLLHVARYLLIHLELQLSQSATGLHQQSPFPRMPPTPFLGLSHCLKHSSSLISPGCFCDACVCSMYSLTECSLPPVYQYGSNYHFTVRSFSGQGLSLDHSILHSGTLWAVIKWLLKTFPVSVDKDIEFLINLNRRSVQQIKWQRDKRIFYIHTIAYHTI